MDSKKCKKTQRGITLLQIMGLVIVFGIVLTVIGYHYYR